MSDAFRKSPANAFVRSPAGARDSRRYIPLPFGDVVVWQLTMFSATYAVGPGENPDFPRQAWNFDVQRLQDGLAAFSANHPGLVARAVVEQYPGRHDIATLGPTGECVAEYRYVNDYNLVAYQNRDFPTHPFHRVIEHWKNPKWGESETSRAIADRFLFNFVQRSPSIVWPKRAWIIPGAASDQPGEEELPLPPCVDATVINEGNFVIPWAGANTEPISTVLSHAVELLRQQFNEDATGFSFPVSLEVFGERSVGVIADYIWQAANTPSLP